MTSGSFVVGTVDLCVCSLVGWCSAMEWGHFANSSEHELMMCEEAASIVNL